MFMTPEELQDLTGRKRTPDQISWLHANRIPFLLDANGKPKILKATITSLLGTAHKPDYSPQLRLG